MFCKNCGNFMNEGEKFCKSCGAPAPQQPQQNTYGFQQNTQQTNYQGYQQGYNTYQTRQASPSVSFGDAIRLYFQNYVNFNGRARRSEYWFAYLFVFLANFVMGLILPDFSFLLTLAFFLPSLAVAVRRLHDVGKSGWFYLWILLPLAGVIILLIQMCKDSDPGDNRFGPSTKY